MFTSAPEITHDGTVGQVVIPSTPTPTPSPTTTSQSATATPTSTATSKAATATPTARAGATAYPTTPPIPGSGGPGSDGEGISDQLTPLPLFGQPLSIYGYAPSQSLVQLNGIGVAGRVTAKTDGYFRFESIYSYTALYPELCLYATDIEKRVTQPVCIPPIPEENNIPLEVGPVILSPTISLTKNIVTEGEDVYADGYSVPNSSVRIYLVKQESQRLSLVNHANAYYLPEYQVDTDENGYYELQLPSNSQDNYRLYSSGRVIEENSPKSNTLNYTVISKAISFWRLVVDLLFKSWISLVIFIQISVIIFLSYLLSKSNTKAHRGILKGAIALTSKAETVKEKYIEYLQKIRKIS